MSGIKSADGNTLAETTIEYLTDLDPLYVLPDRIRMEIGPLISDIPDTTLVQMIHKWSLWAKNLNFRSVDTSDEVYQMILADYVTCKTIGDVLTSGAIASGYLQKRLSDLSVIRNDGQSKLSLADVLAEASKCSAKAEELLKRGGYYTSGMKTFIKGKYDKNRPAFGRLWVRPDENDINRVPGGNTKVKYGRRLFTTWGDPD